MPCNEFDQLIGEPLSREPRTHSLATDIISGTRGRLEALDATRHGESLYTALERDQDSRHWTYLPYGPFDHLQAYLDWLTEQAASEDPRFFAVVDMTGKAVGVASYLRDNPASASVEVGHIRFSSLLQRTVLSTEAMYLMAKRVFDAGYRRYEWKCDACNAPSRRAAERLGFTFEGIFRQATHYKGRNRDTAWYSMLDSEWPARRALFEAWLAPSNFDVEGKQRTRLSP